MNASNVKINSGVNKPAWSSSTLTVEEEVYPLGARIEGTEDVIEPLKLPVFAHIRTIRAIFDRVKIIHETRDDFRITYKTINRRGIPEVQTETVRKQDIRVFRLYSDN